jgi:transposase-like protein
MSSALSAPQFHNEQAAFDWVEAHLWPNGPVCPFCNAGSDRIGRLAGATTRPGLCKCYACRKPFTVRIGTIFESSHVALRIWLQAIYLICSSKKGISTRQLQRTLGVGMKTAWFLGHRIRHAMAPGEGAAPIGGEGKTVELDETFIGRSPKTKKRPGYQHKMAVFALVERGGPIRSMPLDRVSNYDIRNALKDNLDHKSRVVTDGAQYYRYLGVASHESVNHAKGEYVRGDVHTNTLEGYFSVFKRGLVGIYQHIDEKHLHRYCAEFDFRQNYREKAGFNDLTRAQAALKATAGKRLTYRTTNSGATT